MLSRSMYTSEYIGDLYKKTGNDPTLLERAVYAFGLLEAVKRVGLPFCFKVARRQWRLLGNDRSRA